MLSAITLTLLLASTSVLASPQWPSHGTASYDYSATATSTAGQEPTCIGTVLTPDEQLAAGILVNIDWQVHELA